MLNPMLCPKGCKLELAGSFAGLELRVCQHGAFAVNDHETCRSMKPLSETEVRLFKQLCVKGDDTSK